MEDTKKAKAYRLFAKGYGPSSPEVKTLGLTSGTRAGYFSLWNKAGKPGTPGNPAEEEFIPQGSKPISEAEMVTLPPPEESNVEEEPFTEGEEESTEEPLRENKEEKSEESRGDEGGNHTGANGKKFPIMVAGQGLTFNVALSTKTITLYQIAANMNPEELTLGDFIDACVEDTFRGSGVDLGLVRIGKGGNHGHG